MFQHRPDFAPQSSDEEDEDMESHIQNRLGQPSSRDIDMTTTGAPETGSVLKFYFNYILISHVEIRH